MHFLALVADLTEINLVLRLKNIFRFKGGFVHFSVFSVSFGGVVFFFQHFLFTIWVAFENDLLLP